MLRSKFPLILGFLLVFLLVFSALAIAKEPIYPDYSGFVNDFAGVIDDSTKQRMEDLCQALEKRTSAEMAIAVVKTVEPLDSKEYAVKLFEKWKIGKKGKDNGILILLAMEEKRVEIEVGYGLEGVIPDARAGQILDEFVVPYFKQGKFGEGLYNGAAAISDRIGQAAGQEMEDKYQAKKAESESDYSFIAVVVISIIVVTLLSVFGSGLFAGLFGGAFGAWIGYLYFGIIGLVIGAIIGFVVSFTNLCSRASGGGWGPGSFGGGGFSGGGGFGGFGGGSSGGGGAGRSW